MEKQIRVGVVGCGKIARVGHVPGIQSSGNGSVVALCDIVMERAEAMRDDLAPEAEIFSDLDDMLGAGLDALCVCTPNNLHYPMTIAALEAGLHVLCDKPMAATLTEASNMIAAARNAGKVLHINQSMYYSPPHVTIAGLINDGRIGDITHLRCIRASATTPDKHWSPGAAWFVSSKAQGGLILDIGIHMADMLRWYGGAVSEINAFVDTRTPDIDVPDNVNAMMRFENGAIGMLELSWTQPGGANLLEIYGTEGRIRSGFSEQPIELTLFRDGGEPEVSYPAVKQGVKSSYHNFADAVLGVTPSLTPGELGRDALALCDAIRRSGETGKVEKVVSF